MGQTDESAVRHDGRSRAGERAKPAGTTTVTLTIGAAHREVRIARLVAAGMAAMAAFDLESTEDLRIAVDEACVWLIEQGDRSPLRLTFATVEPGCVRVNGETTYGNHSSDRELTGLAAQILAASCEQHSFEVADGLARFSLTATALDPTAPPTAAAPAAAARATADRQPPPGSA